MMKKLLNDGLDLTDGQVAERSSARGLSGGFTPPIAVFAGHRANASFLGPEGRSLMENTPFGGFRAGLRT